MKKRLLFLIITSFCLISNSQSFDTLTLTPPMGWNSWDCYGMDVTEAQIKATADYMAANLKKYGWEYVVLDMGWNYGDGLSTLNFRIENPPQCIDSYGRLIPNPDKFPSSIDGLGLKLLADYVHSKGLKFGLHIMRGIPWQAVEEDTPIKNSKYSARDIFTEDDPCRWFNGLVTVDMEKEGAQEYYNSLVEMYAEWGVDYIKADDMMQNNYRGKEITAIRKAIDKTGRPIVLSLSAGPVSVDHVEHLRSNANLWRVSGDMWDDWSYLDKQFKLCREWQDYVVPGHWPDCDMLPLGKLRINGTDGLLAKRIGVDKGEVSNEDSRFTDPEKYTNVTLWAIFRSPLMMGGDLLQLDDLTFSLLTNNEVIQVNQHSTNNRELRADENEIIWTAEDSETGATYVAMFNLNENNSRLISVTVEELGLKGKFNVRDLWAGKEAGRLEKAVEFEIPAHGCGLYKICK